MKNRFSVYLSQPALVNDRPWLSVLLCVVIVIFILSVFEPFNFRLNSSGQVWILIGFALVTMLVTSLVFVVFPKLFKRFYNPANWTVGRSLLNNVFLLLLCGAGIVCYDYLIVMKQSPAYFPMGFLIDLFASLTIGIIPISAITIISQNHALKKHLTTSQVMNQALSGRVKTDLQTIDFITLNSSAKDSVTMRAEDIICLEASGNYVVVHYRKDGKMNKKLLRSTIKQMEESLRNHAVFIRSHRAFIVNVSQIASVNGNAQGYKLTLFDMAHEIPVSRTYLKALKDALH